MIVMRMIRGERNSKKDYYTIEDVISSSSNGEGCYNSHDGQVETSKHGERILKQ